MIFEDPLNSASDPPSLADAISRSSARPSAIPSARWLTSEVMLHLSASAEAEEPDPLPPPPPPPLAATSAVAVHGDALSRGLAGQDRPGAHAEETVDGRGEGPSRRCGAALLGPNRRRRRRRDGASPVLLPPPPPLPLLPSGTPSARTAAATSTPPRPAAPGPRPDRPARTGGSAPASRRAAARE